MTDATFPGRLRALREAAGLTQAELAAKLGVAGNTVYRWESGRQAPRWEDVCRLADALRVKTDRFR